MKKIVLVLLCAFCLLAAAPVCAKADDIADATKVIKAYYDTGISGDIDGSMKYMSKANQAQFEAEKAEISKHEGLMEFSILLAKQSSYEIESVELQGEEIHARVIMRSPNPESILNKASEGIDFTNDAEYERFFKHALDIAKIELESKTMEMVDKSYATILIKEDGQWKIDKE